ncbi:MAG TPA: 30S ribosomal protein S21 [Anaerolineae bacterium]|nr:30S ribosomal protein S21 [Anaerolineae bacterium]HOR00802.1 30S ribosomal protein S21 [Anaerolineae bacterium]HPL28535.1 30S ribosomal protein S21 [Anaerolineae bacterium]
MVTAIQRGGESFDSLFKRFRKKVQEEKVLSEYRRHRFYEKPSQVRKRKAAKKLSKSRRTTRKMQQRFSR